MVHFGKFRFKWCRTRHSFYDMTCKFLLSFSVGNSTVKCISSSPTLSLSRETQSTRKTQVVLAYCVFLLIFRCWDVRGYDTCTSLRWQQRDRHMEDDAFKLHPCVSQIVCFRTCVSKPWLYQTSTAVKTFRASFSQKIIVSPESSPQLASSST